MAIVNRTGHDAWTGIRAEMLPGQKVRGARKPHAA